MAEKQPQTVVHVDWSEVKDAYLRTIAEAKSWPSQPAASVFTNMGRNPYAPDWHAGRKDGDTRGRESYYCAADALQWVREGYYGGSFADAVDIPTEARIRPRYSEEGDEPEVGRLLGGYDDFMFGVERRKKKPGIRLEIDMMFAALCDGAMLTRYGAWLAKLIKTFEEKGYDLSISLRICLDQLFVGKRGRSHVHVEVKKPGELSDFREWSSLFSPASVRSILFVADLVAGDKIGAQVTGTFGMTCPTSEINWDAQWNEEDATLRITADQRAGKNFPEEKMTSKLREAGLI